MDRKRLLFVGIGLGAVAIAAITCGRHCIRALSREGGGRDALAHCRGVSGARCAPAAHATAEADCRPQEPISRAA
jgi:hypothetical protein